jgi:hypothetical protein
MNKKEYTVVSQRNGYGSTGTPLEYTGTIPELLEMFNNTLNTGRSWQHEKGNKKIPLKIASIGVLVTSLNKAVDNAAADGYSTRRYSEAAS